MIRDVDLGELHALFSSLGGNVYFDASNYKRHGRKIILKHETEINMFHVTCRSGAEEESVWHHCEVIDVFVSNVGTVAYK